MLKIVLYLTRDEDGDLYLSTSLPYKSEIDGTWVTNTPDPQYELDNYLFPEVKWGDPEPTRLYINKP